MKVANFHKSSQKGIAQMTLPQEVPTNFNKMLQLQKVSTVKFLHYIVLWLRYLGLDLRKPVFHAHNSKTQFSIT